MVRGLSWVMTVCAAVLLLAYVVDLNGPTPRWHTGLRQTLAAVFFGSIPLWLGALALRDGRAGPRLWLWPFAVVWAGIVLLIAVTFLLTAGATLEALQFQAQGGDGGFSRIQQRLLLFKPSPSAVVLWSALLSIVAILSWTEDPDRPGAGKVRTVLALACVLPCAGVAYADDAAGFWMLTPAVAPPGLRALALGGVLFVTLLTIAAVLGNLAWSRGAHFVVGLFGSLVIGGLTIFDALTVQPGFGPIAIWPALIIVLLWALLAFVLGGALHQTGTRLPNWAILTHALVFGLAMLASVAPRLYLAFVPVPERLTDAEMQRHADLINALAELTERASLVLPVLFALGLITIFLFRAKAPAP